MGLPHLLTDTNARSGFSLLEALAALGLTGMLFATGLPLFVQFVGQWSVGTDRLMAADEWMSATARIADDLAQALPLKMGLSDQTPVAFHGTPNQVDFVRTALGGRGNFRLDFVTLSIAPQNRGRVAVIRAARAFSANSFNDPPDLADGVTLLELRQPATFEFIDTAGKVQESWDPAAGLPSRVELKLDASDAKRMGVPLLVFPVVSGSSLRKPGKQDAPSQPSSETGPKR
jgi:general secretion pathway protein J